MVSRVSAWVAVAGLAGWIAYLGYRIDQRLSALERRLDPRPEQAVAGIPMSQPGPSAAPATPLAPQPPDESLLSAEEFLQVWSPRYVDQAEKECFVPGQAAKREDITPHPRFEVGVSAEGRVVRAEPDPVEKERSPVLTQCVGRIIRTMSFPPAPTQRSGRVQANRVHAFVIASQGGRSHLASPDAVGR
jgi:hypothetical protein